MTVTILPYGERAVLFEVDDTAAAADLARWLKKWAHDAHDTLVTDVVPGARTVLVRCPSPHARSVVELATADYRRGSDDVPVGELIELPVVYDGDDLATVATAIGLSTTEVIERHSSVVYEAAFCGFAPGFCYLTGLDPALHIARRATPRPLVRASSVAIASEYTAVYPTASPGGWHILGHAEATLWDTRREAPALLTPGCRVRFVPQRS